MPTLVYYEYGRAATPHGTARTITSYHVPLDQPTLAHASPRRRQPTPAQATPHNLAPHALPTPRHLPRRPLRRATPQIDLPHGCAELPEGMQPVKEFAGLKCGRVIGRNLKFAGFTVPTPVQGNSVPIAIGGWDVVSIAQTGSGKTLAFMLPILYRLLEQGPSQPSGGRGRGRPPVRLGWQ